MDEAMGRSWLGARMDQRVDDASVVHPQASGLMGNLGMVSAMGGDISTGQKQGERGQKFG